MRLEISILAGLGGSGERLYSQHPLSLRPTWCTNQNDQGYTEKSRLKKKYFITGNLRERVRRSWLVGGHLWKHSAIELLVWDLFIRLMAETRLEGRGERAGQSGWLTPAGARSLFAFSLLLWYSFEAGLSENQEAGSRAPPGVPAPTRTHSQLVLWGFLFHWPVSPFSSPPTQGVILTALREEFE